MEGRNRIHPREMQLGGGGGGRSSQPPLLPTPLIDHNRRRRRHHHEDFHPHPALIEEQLHHQHREIQNLLLDNQRLAATHVALKQELSASKEEIRHISTVASQVKAERDVEIRSLHQRSLQLESEVVSIGKFSADLAQAKVDIQKLNANKLELTSKLESINDDLVRARGEREESKSVESDVEAMRLEVQKGRAAIEFEKKAHAENLEHKQILEKNMNELTKAIERLRSEIADAEKRAEAANAPNASAVVIPAPGPVYGGNYGNPQMGYVGAGPSYVDPVGPGPSYVDPNAANASMGVAPNPGPVYGGSYGNPQMGYVGAGPSYVDPVGAGPSYVDPVGAQAANSSMAVAPNPGPVYAGSYGNPQMGYVGAGPSHVDPYNMHHMVQPNFGAQFHYGSEVAAYAPYCVQQSQVHR